MELSATRDKVATWLELAVARDGCRDRRRVRVHAIGERGDDCYAISLDGRWLCAGSGQLTVFHGLGAALHFLEVLRIAHFEAGASTRLPSIRGNCYCLRMDRSRGLLRCGRMRAKCDSAA
ncbi:hypothetical protein [Aromatoleum evansii]|uniref:hypothetical protein n=1 Tax=Aromatoleum evansii TaxID=59406 RepID=UPI00145CB8D5|nr:hypothetical protein [Aromatoleum evansii]NMG30012.1 hypothetical protein [Aromatoleum evansii]